MSAYRRAYFSATAQEFGLVSLIPEIREQEFMINISRKRLRYLSHNLYSRISGMAKPSHAPPTGRRGGALRHRLRVAVLQRLARSSGVVRSGGLLRRPRLPLPIGAGAADALAAPQHGGACKTALSRLRHKGTRL